MFNQQLSHPTTNYKIIFSKNEPPNLSLNDIWIDNGSDLERIVYCTGNNIQLFFDDYMKSLFPEIYTLYLSGKITQISDRLVCNYKDPHAAIDILKKLPIPDHIILNFKENHSPIDKNYVHKRNQQNVFISIPQNIGNLFFFQGYSNISELQTDHETDHFDGIKIFEVSRQASIAAMVLNGFPADAINILTQNYIQYRNFIDKDRPYYIQALPAVQSNGGHLYCAFSIIQNNKICALGFFAGVGYTNIDEYLNARKGNKKLQK